MHPNNNTRRNRKSRLRRLTNYTNWGIENAPGFLTKPEKHLLTQVKKIDALQKIYKEKTGKNFIHSQNWKTYKSLGRAMANESKNRLKGANMNNTMKNNIARAAGVRAALEVALAND